MARRKIASKLSEHPRIVGALFTACTLLTAAGNVVAEGGGGTAGP